MNNIRFQIAIILLVELAACGQPGPLYLPKDAPSVYTEPKPADSANNKNEDGKPAANDGQQPVQPDNKQQ